MSIEKLLAKSKELREKSTGANWYAHSAGDQCERATVRGPFGRWFECREVLDIYSKHVGSSFNDCIYAANALNTDEVKDKIILELIGAMMDCLDDYNDSMLPIVSDTINAALHRCDELAREALKDCP